MCFADVFSFPLRCLLNNKYFQILMKSTLNAGLSYLFLTPKKDLLNKLGAAPYICNWFV